MLRHGNKKRLAPKDRRKKKERLFHILIILALSFLSFFYISLPALASGLTPAKHRQEEKKNQPSADRINQSYLRQVGQDFFSLVQAPRKWEGPDIMNLAAVIGTGTVIFTLDQDIFNWVAERRSSFSQDVAKVSTRFGDGGFLLVFTSGLYVAGELLGQPGLRKSALLSLESLAFSSLIVASIKFLGGRARPHAWEGSQSFHPFSFSAKHTSFPSGHASAAFAVATTLACSTENKIIDVSAYSLATMAALARVHDEAHWASDVLVGSALGYFVGRYVANLHRPEERKMSFLFFPRRGCLTFSLVLTLD